MEMEFRDLNQTVDRTEDTEVDRETAALQMSPGNGRCSNHNITNSSEVRSLMEDHAAVDSNGGHYSVDIPRGSSGQSHNSPVQIFRRLKTNELTCWKLKVWIIIIISFILIFLVIFLPVYFCSVHKEDMDEKYNVMEFVVPRFFTGNFTFLKNNMMTDEQLICNLRQKLTHTYTSSHALGRYFSLATVNPLRDNRSLVEYKLKFVMPEEHGQIVLYFLSKEMVYSVLLQELFDQETEDPLYIEPESLTMEGIAFPTTTTTDQGGITACNHPCDMPC